MTLLTASPNVLLHWKACLYYLLMLLQGHVFMPIWLPMREGRLNKIRENFKEFNEENFIVLSAIREWTLHHSPHCWEWEKINKKILNNRSWRCRKYSCTKKQNLKKKKVFRNCLKVDMKLALAGWNMKQKGSLEMFVFTSKTTNHSINQISLPISTRQNKWLSWDKFSHDNHYEEHCLPMIFSISFLNILVWHHVFCFF